MALVVVLPQSVATMTLILSGSSLLTSNPRLNVCRCADSHTPARHPHPHRLQVLRLRAIGGDGVIGSGAGSGENLKTESGRRMRRRFAGRRLPRLAGGRIQQSQEFRFFQKARARTAQEQAAVGNKMYGEPVQVQMR